MNDQEKRNYNKEHYRKNRQIILERMKSRYKNKRGSFENVIPLFGNKRQELNKILNKEKTPKDPSQILTKRPRLGTLFLLLLAAGNGYFLVTEMAQFYASADPLVAGFQLAAYLKAGLLEGSILTLCLVFRPKLLCHKILRYFLILLAYSYSIWVISSLSVQTSISASIQSSITEKRMIELESEIAKKITLRDSYFQVNRVTLARKMETQLTELKLTLEKNREDLVKSPAGNMIWNTLLAVILFRVMIMMSNFICLQELARRHRLNSKTV